MSSVRTRKHNANPITSAPRVISSKSRRKREPQRTKAGWVRISLGNRIVEIRKDLAALALAMWEAGIDGIIANDGEWVKVVLGTSLLASQLLTIAVRTHDHTLGSIHNRILNLDSGTHAGPLTPRWQYEVFVTDSSLADDNADVSTPPKILMYVGIGFPWCDLELVTERLRAARVRSA